MMKLLIENGANVNGRNAYYDTPLIYTLQVKVPNMGIVKLLVESGADVNLPNAFGVTAFIGACGTGNLNLVKYFLEHGAKKKQINNIDMEWNRIL